MYHWTCRDNDLLNEKVKTHFSQKPLCHLNQNFIWIFFRVGERKMVLLVTWPFYIYGQKLLKNSFLWHQNTNGVWALVCSIGDERSAKSDQIINEPWHEISNNMVCATSKASVQPAHTHSLIRAFASRLSILWLLSYWQNTIWSF